MVKVVSLLKFSFFVSYLFIAVEKQNNRDRKKFLKVFLTVSEDSVSSHLLGFIGV